MTMTTAMKTIGVLTLAAATIMGARALSNGGAIDHSDKELKLTAPLSSTITFNHNGGLSVALNGDGSVEVKGGTLDEGAKLFWQKVTQVFPDFKESICNEKNK